MKKLKQAIAERSQESQERIKNLTDTLVLETGLQL
ncbi:Uncharacterised protein [Providencia rustigianii]|nr:Uncharacterised protein [Providencia rustigianii]VEB63503.1 Uncharacterised protein [Providencia rustigianii]